LGIASLVRFGGQGASISEAPVEAFGTIAD
jgi:hypothetical protein